MFSFALRENVRLIQTFHPGLWVLFETHSGVCLGFSERILTDLISVWCLAAVPEELVRVLDFTPHFLRFHSKICALFDIEFIVFDRKFIIFDRKFMSFDRKSADDCFGFGETV